MGQRIPFKAKDGLDSNQKRVINVADPVEDKDAINKRYFEANTLGLGVNYVYVSDVVSDDPVRPVFIEFDYGVYVSEFTSANSDIQIVISFGKLPREVVFPDIEFFFSTEEEPTEFIWQPLFSQAERDSIDYSVVNHTWASGELEVINNNEFKFYYNAASSSGYYFFRNDTTIYRVKSVAAELPEVTSATYYQFEYPVPQTELSDGQEVTMLVTSDKNIYEVNVNGTYILPNSETYTGTSTSAIITTLITGGPTGTDTPIDAYFQIRVKDEFGTWSSWYVTQNGNEGTEYIKINNTAPVFSGVSIAYPAGQQALGISQTGTVNYTVSYLGSVPNGSLSYTDLGSNFSSVILNGTTSASVVANTSLYRYDTNTLRVTATREKNGKSTTTNFKVNIATAPTVISAFTPLVMKSGESGYSNTFGFSTNQRILTTSTTLVNPPTGISVSSQGSIISTGVINGGILIYDTAAKGDFTIRTSVQNLALQETIQTFVVSHVGFVQRTIGPVSIQSAVQIPTVVDPTNLIVQIGNGTQFSTCSYFGGSTETVYVPGFQGDVANLNNEFQVYNVGSEWFIVFDNNVLGLASQGDWVDVAYIIIQE